MNDSWALYLILVKQAKIAYPYGTIIRLHSTLLEAAVPGLIGSVLHYQPTASPKPIELIEPIDGIRHKFPILEGTI